MKLLLRKVGIPLILLLAVFGSAIAVNRLGGMAVAVLRVRAAEFFMVQPVGPRLGRRPVRDDIVLILYDVRTATDLGYVRSYDDDLTVYQNLVDAGVSVVYDTRSCAAATKEDFALLRPLLDGMLNLEGVGSQLHSEGLGGINSEVEPQVDGPSGSGRQPAELIESRRPDFGRARVLREIYLGTQVSENGISQYSVLAASNPLNSFPHAVPAARVRLYPIAYIDSLGTRESAPLAISRRFWETPLLESQPLVEELSRSGILTEWHAQFPNDTTPSTEPASAYTIGPNSLNWYPFASNSILVLPAGFWVGYEPNCLDYPRYSYLDILRETEGQAEPPSLSGKIAIVGYSLEVDPGSEIYEVPCGAGKACAAEVVALATQTVLGGRIMRPLPPWLDMSLLAGLCLVLGGLAIWLRPAEGLATALAIVILYFVGVVLAYRLGWMADFVIAPSAGILAAVVCGTFSAWRSHKNHGRVVDMFGRYVPRAVVNQLILQPELNSLKLGGTQREVSVLFADIRGFTTFAERLPPDQVVLELNGLLRDMVDCTFQNEGTLDKFIGDAILVLFNAPLDQPDHVRRCITTALQIQEKLDRRAGGLKVGIGLHVGQAVVGNIGTPERMEYTAIGNTVNIAARLCEYAEGGSIVVSQAVAEKLSADYALTPHQPIQVKGISDPIAVWSVLGSKNATKQG